jgi:hypothetical protein
MAYPFDTDWTSMLDEGQDMYTEFGLEIHVQGEA